MSDNTHIVTFHDHVDDASVDAHKAQIETQGGSITHDYRPILKGFAFQLPDGGAHATTLGSNPDVKNIEADKEMKTQ